MGLVSGRSQYNWEHGIPCHNPNCKSFGKPHPNCKCGGGGPKPVPSSITQNYAEGGPVHFCSGDTAHENGCEYYAGNPDLGKSVLKNAIQRHDSEDDLTESLLGKSKPEMALHGLTAKLGALKIIGSPDNSLFNNSASSKKLSDLGNEKLSKKLDQFINKMSMTGPEDAMSPGFLKETVRPEVEKIIGNSNPHVIDAVINAVSHGETQNMTHIIKHASSVSKGHKDIDASIESLFNGPSVDQSPSLEDRDKLKEFIAKGGVNSQISNETDEMNDSSPVAMAEGGEPNQSQAISPVDKAFPEQSMLLGMTKTNLSNYLQQMQPEKDKQLPFDSEYKNEAKNRDYNKALDIANKPLSVLEHIKDGRLTQEHLQHLTGMYPDLHQHLGKKITERVLKAQLDNERPSYRSRQFMSMFLGSPLDSTLSPQSIQAVQSIYSPKQPAPQGGQPQKAKKGTSKLGEISKDHYTQDQASQQRATAWD